MRHFTPAIIGLAVVGYLLVHIWRDLRSGELRLPRSDWIYATRERNPILYWLVVGMKGSAVLFVAWAVVQVVVETRS